MTKEADGKQARQRYITQLPGYADGPGAVLEIRGLPNGAQVMSISISRKDKWLTSKGWVDDRSELPVTSRWEGDERLLVDLPRDASTLLSPGHQVRVAIPGHDLSDVLVWRSLNAIEDRFSAAPATTTTSNAPEWNLGERSMGWLVIPVGALVLVAALIFVGIAFVEQDTLDQARTTETSATETRVSETSGPQSPRPQSGEPQSGGSQSDDAPARLESGTRPAATPAREPEYQQVSGREGVCQDIPIAPVAEDAWSAELFERNVRASLREAKRLMLRKETEKAGQAFKEAACRSKSAAIEVIAFLDPNLNPEAAAFGNEGRTLAIDVHRIALQRWQNMSSARFLNDLEGGQ